LGVGGPVYTPIQLGQFLKNLDVVIVLFKIERLSKIGHHKVTLLNDVERDKLILDRETRPMDFKKNTPAR
jgi:hypothetical protein